MKKYTKIYAKENGNGEIVHGKDSWRVIKWIIGALIILAAVLPAISWLGGKNQGIVISGENIKRIPAIASEVESLTGRVDKIDYVIQEIPEMKKDITTTKEGVARLEGNIDVLIKRGK